MVGSFEPRKNVSVAIDAFSRICHGGPELKLLLVGKENEYQRQMIRKVKELKLEETVLFPGYIPDHELSILYSVATALLFPSSAEGFGLPIIEAMATGCPIIASSLPVFHEIGGDAVVYVPPGNEAALADEMARMLEDPAHRGGLVLNGMSRSLNYSWDHAAEETVRVYVKVLKKRNVDF